MQINFKAIMINPNDAAIYLGRGMAYKSQENYSKAISDLNKAIEIDPNSPPDSSGGNQNTYIPLLTHPSILYLL